MKVLLRLGFIVLAAGSAIVATSLWWLHPVNADLKQPAFFAIENDQQRADYLKNLTPDQVREIEQYGTDALSLEPLNRTGIEALAVVRSLQGYTSSAEKLMLSAADLSFRNSSIQFSAMVQLLTHKNYTKALYHADGLLRAHPEMADYVFPVFSKLLVDKIFLKELSNTLALQPAWRGSFLTHLAEKGGGAKAIYVVLAALKQGKSPITDDEQRKLIGLFVNDKNYESAYFTWLDMLDERGLQRVNSVFDGDFDLEPRYMYFDWSMGGLVNTRIRIVPRPGNQLDRNLSIDFFNETRRFGNVRQFLRLAPGSYQMNYELMARDLKTDGGLVWRVRCLEVNTDLGVSKLHLDSGPWATYSFKFIVPPKGCNTQSLTLETKSYAPLDAKISGQMNIDNVSINRLP
jgi:hypothetical protein